MKENYVMARILREKIKKLATLSNLTWILTKIHQNNKDLNDVYVLSIFNLD